MKPKVKQARGSPAAAATTTPPVTPKSKKLRKKAEPSNLPTESSRRPVPDLPDVAPLDAGRMCVRYSALLDRDSEVDPATADEIDPLQHELEHMLMYNMDIQTRITDTLSQITNGEFPTTSQLKSKSSRLKPVVLKRGEPDNDDDDTDIPKLKVRSAGGASPSTIRVPKSSYGRKNDLMAHNVAVPGYDKAGRKRIYFWPQNHMPDKFWASVAEYAPEMTTEDIKFLQQRIRNCSHDRLLPYLNTPALGKHYSTSSRSKPPADDNDDEKSDINATPARRVSRSMSAQQHVNGNGVTSPTSTMGRKRRHANADNEPSPSTATPSGRQSRQQKDSAAASNGVASDSAVALGPLTERLVQALVEEQSTNGSVNGDAKMTNGNASNHAPEMLNGAVSPSKALVKSLNLGNMAALEKRIKKELEAQGFLEDEDAESSSDSSPSPVPVDDEVSAELALRQAELRQLAESNRRRLADVLEKATRAVELQDIQREVDKANQTIDALYKRFYSVVPKRKPCTKKERDQLTAALNNRKQLVAQLNQMTVKLAGHAIKIEV